MTLRLRVTDARGRVGEERRTIAVHHDPSLIARLPEAHRSRRRGPAGARRPAGHAAASTSCSATPTAASTPSTRRPAAELPGWPVHTNPTVVVEDATPASTPATSRSSATSRSATSSTTARSRSSPRRRPARCTCSTPTALALPGWPKALDLERARRPRSRGPSLPFTRLPHAWRGRVAGARRPRRRRHARDRAGRRGTATSTCGDADGTNLAGWPVKVDAACGLRAAVRATPRSTTTSSTRCPPSPTSTATASPRSSCAASTPT